MLTGEGRKWWKSQLNTEFKSLQPAPWERFRDNFFQQYFPHAIKEKKLRDFIHLKQGSMSVMKYEALFTALSDYARHLVADLREKAKRFEDGMRKDIQKQTNVMRIYNYAELYQRALIAEQNINEDREWRERKQCRYEQVKRHEGSFEKKRKEERMPTDSGMKCQSCGGHHLTFKCRNQSLF
ncbi:hypothetical protein AXF42_Ash000500 [Apostasia shenzhenica]|uniref:Retrotransposon gag domain-containing protein n=1 Tax=Apostasia shenzhenica TaxID=1088818 RepID=A0A2I0AGM2_9ASPA|nr:hypothetical protein AXF42_Ash000500 [Apostasia shenzhenica]